MQLQRSSAQRCIVSTNVVFAKRNNTPLRCVISFWHGIQTVGFERPALLGIATNMPVACWLGRGRIPCGRADRKESRLRQKQSRKLIQSVSPAVGCFMPTFTSRQSDFPNFATQNVKHTTISCGMLACWKIKNTTFCGLLSLNNRNSLYY